MLKFLSSIWNRVRSFFRRILNYGNHNNAEHKNTHSTNTFKTNNSNIGKDMDNGQLTIHEAIEQNHWEEALELISKAQPDDVNAKNELGQTPLHLAVAVEWLGRYGPIASVDKRDDIIKALIEKGADTDAQDKDGETVVHYISRWLLNNQNNGKVRANAPPNFPGPVVYDRDLISALKKLTEHNPDVNIEDNKGNTALDNIMKAKWSEKSQSALGVIKILLEAGAHIKNQEQTFGILKGSIEWGKAGYESCYYYANDCVEKYDILKMVDLVISRGITSVKEGETKVRDNVDINYQDKKGNTALSFACENKRFDVIKLLIEKGANLETIIPSTKKRFMTYVLEENLFDFVPSLNFDVVLENGLTPLMTAAQFGNHNSIRTLVEKYEANINYSDGFGRKAIYYAAAGGSAKIVNYLLDHGANINDLDGRGNTTLHYAAANKDGNENIALLIEKGIDVNCQNKNGIRPINLAVANNCFMNFQILLNKNASLEMKDFEGVKK